MKKILISIALILSLLAVGCNATDEPKSIDNKFISDVSKAIESRWNYLDTTTEESENVYLKQAVQKELDILTRYIELNEEEEIFSDPKLKKIAEDYINALNTQIESLKYYTADYVKYDEQWAEGFNERTTLLVQLVDEYGLKIDENKFAELRENAKVVEENNEIAKEVEDLVKSINFEKVKTEYGWSDFSAIAENSTSVDFEGFEVKIKLLDEDGVTVSDELVWIDNWNKGEKKKLEFSTDTSFSEMKWEVGDYYTK